MSSMLFAIEVLAILAVILWARKNDAMPLDGGGTGLFAMRDGNDTAKPDKAPRWGAPARQKTGKLVNATPPRWKPRPPPVRH